VSQNYPNPFNPSTVINYSVPDAQFVTIRVYNMLGQEIATLVNEEVEAGIYNVTWNGVDNSGIKVATGTYIYRVVAGSNVATKKMILLK
jgi:flagellar hook assembly protein FlgD